MNFDEIDPSLQQPLLDNPDGILPKLKNPRISNCPTKKGLREITVDVINKLISVPAMVVRTTEVKPMGTKICYRCDKCGVLQESKTQGLVTKTPKKCICGNTELSLDPDNSDFINFQQVRLQE